MLAAVTTCGCFGNQLRVPGHQHAPTRWSGNAGQPPAVLEAASREAAAAWHHSDMRCRGCAAKVDGRTLHAVLRQVVGHGQAHPSHHTPATVPDDCGNSAPEGWRGNHRDDAAPVPAVPAGQIAVQTVDHLSCCVSDLHLFGRIAAVHALADCFAMGAAPRTALATVQV